MKNLLLTILFLPLLAAAQDSEQQGVYHNPKNEIGFNTGTSLRLPAGYFSTGLEPRFVLSYLCNFKQIQVGLALESGKDDYGYAYLSPMLLSNYRFHTRSSYFYAGAAAGYYYAAPIGNFSPAIPDNNLQGYTLGIQGGYIWNVSKSFGITSEIAVRSTQYWFDNYYFVPTGPYRLEQDGYFVEYVDTDFSLSFPITVGIRYKF